MKSLPPATIYSYVDYTYLYFIVSYRIPLDTKTKMCFYEGEGI